MAEPGTVELDIDGRRLSLRFPTGVMRADVSAQEAYADVIAGGNGGITINSHNLNLSESFLLAGIENRALSDSKVTGAITFDSTGEVKISESIISNNTDVSAIDEVGKVSSTSSWSVLLLERLRNWIFSSFRSIFLQRQNQQELLGGIRIKARSLSLTDDTELSASAFEEREAGNISIQVEDAVNLSNSEIFAVTLGNSNAGDIRIRSRSLTLMNRSVLNADTYGRGKRGNLNIDAESVSLSDDSRFLATLRSLSFPRKFSLNIH